MTIKTDTWNGSKPAWGMARFVIRRTCWKGKTLGARFRMNVRHLWPRKRIRNAISAGSGFFRSVFISPAGRLPT